MVPAIASSVATVIGPRRASTQQWTIHLAGSRGLDDSSWRCGGSSDGLSLVVLQVAQKVQFVRLTFEVRRDQRLDARPDVRMIDNDRAAGLVACRWASLDRMVGLTQQMLHEPVSI